MHPENVTSGFLTFSGAIEMEHWQNEFINMRLRSLKKIVLFFVEPFNLTNFFIKFYYLIETYGMKDYSFLFKGRYNAHDIANFIKESVESNVKVLSPEEFNKIGKNEDKWFVDFYAPVCKN